MTIHEETYRGYHIAIEPDPDAESPRDAYSPMGTMVLFDSRRDLPNETSLDYNDFADWDELAAILKNEQDAALLIAVWTAGDDLVCSTYTPGDVRRTQKGFIFVNQATIDDEYADDPDANQKTYAYMEGEVESLSRWLKGDFCGYDITPRPGTHGDANDVLSCWGFETIENALADAKELIDSLVRAEETRIHTGITY